MTSSVAVTTPSTWNESDGDNMTSSLTSSSGLLSKHEDIWYGCFVVTGVILPLGLVCNTLSLIVFMTSKAMIKTSTGHYLVALSIADWLFLVGDFIRWLHSASPATKQFYVDVNFMYRVGVVCKLTHFLRYGAKLASAWTTIAITVERYISVRWPLHAHHMSTVSRARLVVAAVYLACFALGAYPLWTVDVAQYDARTTACKIVDVLRYEVWSWVSLRIGSLLLPGVLMSILTGLIILSLARAKDQRLTRLSYRQVSQGRTTVRQRKAA